VLHKTVTVNEQELFLLQNSIKTHYLGAFMFSIYPANKNKETKTNFLFDK